jgi:hypothetical protein
MTDLLARLHADGYAIIRGFMTPQEIAAVGAETDRIYAEGLKHHATFRDRNLLFEILNDPKARRRVLLQAHWTAWISAFMERLRRSERLFGVLEPFLGRDIKQITHQIHWKPPGAKYTSYRFHQDARFREGNIKEFDFLRSSVTTGLAIDPQTVENGALRVIPGSHRLGYLGLSDDGPIMVGQTQDAELERAGLDPRAIVTCVMEPGDLLLWTLFTVHGSAPNVSRQDRRFMINSYVRAADSVSRGEWAFRDGRSTPLGAEPEICKYEALRERPGPFYVEDDWTEEGRAAADGTGA